MEKKINPQECGTDCWKCSRLRHCKDIHKGTCEKYKRYQITQKEISKMTGLELYKIQRYIHRNGMEDALIYFQDYYNLDKRIKIENWGQEGKKDYLVFVMEEE